MSISLFNKNTYRIFIQTQKTPNPNFIKFIPTGKQVLQSGTMDYASISETSCTPLAHRLFQIQGISRVFYGQTYLSISKSEDQQWSELKPIIFGVITEFYNSDQPLFLEEPISQDTVVLETDTPIVKEIKECLDARVRPVVQEDGGDIQYINYDQSTGKVYIAMKGSCTGCPSSTNTLKNGIEKTLKHFIPEVTEVLSIDHKPT